MDEDSPRMLRGLFFVAFGIVFGGVFVDATLLHGEQFANGEAARHSVLTIVFLAFPVGIIAYGLVEIRKAWRIRTTMWAAIASAERPNLLRLLFDARPNPTVSWPRFDTTPAFNFDEGRFGPLTFGDPIKAACSLGRPDEFDWIDDNYCQMLYARGGFQIDFEGGKFCYIAFFVGPDKHAPTNRQLEFSRPQIERNGQRRRLLPELPRAELGKIFGPTTNIDEDADEAILYYEINGITVEVELHGKSDRVKRCNLYPRK